MENQTMKTMTINEINNMSRAELITETKVGSIIAYNNFQSFNYRTAIFNILKDQELTNEVCAEFGWDVEILETMMHARVSPGTEAIAKAIGDRLESTMDEDVVLW